MQLGEVPSSPPASGSADAGAPTVRGVSEDAAAAHFVYHNYRRQQ